MSNSPSSKTTSHDSIIPQTSTPWRLSKAISAQQMTSLPSCFLGNKRAIFFSPHSAALDHFDWAVSTAKHSSKPLTTLQQLRFGSNALKTFHATPQSSTSRSPPLAFLWCINKRMLIPKTLHANTITAFLHASHDPLSSAERQKESPIR
ncbi:unnamed protein product [Brassica oleracea var. botrytis]|uniref:(rape) hypothetical protein n=1 Tax=Brassica napus TaxID=3708 RepID=A0A078I4B5_BRANA|nr:unnamed protein product [Brassica napus]CDY45670.1 BnaC09g32120D [Brassica napus]